MNVTSFEHKYNVGDVIEWLKTRPHAKHKIVGFHFGNGEWPLYEVEDEAGTMYNLTVGTVEDPEMYRLYEEPKPLQFTQDELELLDVIVGSVRPWKYGRANTYDLWEKITTHTSLTPGESARLGREWKNS